MRLMRLGMLVLASLINGCAVDVSEPPEETTAGVEQPLAKNALSNTEAATVLQLVDNICGDTWCSGDYNFSFDRIQCHAGCAARPGSCKLTFRMFSYDTNLETGPTFTRSCRTQEFTGFESLVKTLRGRQSLQPDYYDALTECIARVESHLPR